TVTIATLTRPALSGGRSTRAALTSAMVVGQTSGQLVYPKYTNSSSPSGATISIGPSSALGNSTPPTSRAGVRTTPISAVPASLQAPRNRARHNDASVMSRARRDGTLPVWPTIAGRVSGEGPSDSGPGAAPGADQPLYPEARAARPCFSAFSFAFSRLDLSPAV